MNSSSSLNQTTLSDKAYWHGYIPFYEGFFINRNIETIAEFGVYKGKSIRWLLERFPKAFIYGADILPLQSEWPIDARFEFTQLDQGVGEQIHAFLSQCKFDLIIEDGSHQPKHQISCLVEGLEALNPNGVYILEDIQTSLPNHPWWNKRFHWWKFREKAILKAQKNLFAFGNALHALLALDHYKRIGVEVNDAIASNISKDSLIDAVTIQRLAKQINEIHLYRRTHLPDFCHNCGSSDFDFSKFKCCCGEEIFRDTDSMSFVIIKK